MKKLKFLKLFFGITFLLIFIYNGFVAYEYKYEAEGDAWDYIHLGLSVAKEGKYGHFKSSKNELLENFKNTNVGLQDYIYAGDTAFRPPVWPFIIAGIFLIFGYNLTYILIFKFLLHLIGIFIFYKTLKLLNLKQTLSLTGAFLYSISPAWQLYSRVFLSEPITFFFITLWIYLLIRFILNKLSWWPQALVAGIIILCHPYYIFLPFSVWLILWFTRQMRVKTFLFSSIICAFIVSIWMMRNFVVLETNEIVLTTSSGAVMAKGWNQLVPKLHTNTKGDLADEGLVLENYEYNRSQDINEVERMEMYKSASLNFIKSNPDLIIPIISTKLLSAFNPFPETPRPGILETGRWFFQFMALLSLFYILLFTRNRILYSLTIGLILATVGITILTYSGFRFRMPQVGLELLFIVFALNDILVKRINT